MKRRSVNVEIKGGGTNYDVIVGRGLLSTSGRWARKCLGPIARKAVVISDTTVSPLYGEQVLAALRGAGLNASQFVMKDGERFKTLATAEAAIRELSTAGLTRTDVVIALGGGVVGDLAGFAAAVHLRGVPFLNIPTTLLAMVDASVGGKTGVNTPSGKNLVGAFHQPDGVLIDLDVLLTLDEREMRAGVCEMVKHAALSGRELFDATERYLSEADLAINDDLAALIAGNVAYKSAIVTGDEREAPRNNGPRSRKVLNLGHTFAHALEKVSNFRRFRHGEAVGHGLLFAADMSKSLALCGEKDIKSLYDVVHRVGPLPALHGIDEDELADAFGFDKKNLAGALQMVLLRGIGRPVIVPQKDIPRRTFRRVLRQFLQKRA